MSRPEIIGDGVYRVDAIGFRNAVSTLLVEEPDGLTLVDTGVASSAERIRTAISSLGVDSGDLKRVFLTHHHQDHAGGLANILAWATNAEVWSSDREAEIFTRERPKDPSPNAFFRLMTRGYTPPRAEVSSRLRERDRVGGFRVIETPGHTLGHVSLLRDSDGLLFTADAFGRFPPFGLKVGVVKAFCADPARARDSAEKLLDEDFQTVVFAHGKTITQDPKSTLRRVVEECAYT